MASNIKRVWVNAPSTLQQEHQYNGTRLLAEYAGKNDAYVTCYFLAGNVVSRIFSRSSLSPGWPKAAEEKA